MDLKEIGEIVKQNEFEWLISRIKELEADLKLNASMLARQCDLARDAETRAEKAEASKAKLKEAIETIPWTAYGEALRDGCGQDGAWDCFCEETKEHFEKALEE